MTLFLVFTHVTFALTTVAIRHVGAQTNALNREITVRTKALKIGSLRSFVLWKQK